MLVVSITGDTLFVGEYSFCNELCKTIFEVLICKSVNECLNCVTRVFVDLVYLSIDCYEDRFKYMFGHTFTSLDQIVEVSGTRHPRVISIQDL